MGQRDRDDNTARRRGDPRIPAPTAGRVVRFCLLFLLLVLAGHLVLMQEAVWVSVRDPYCLWLAKVCAFALRLVGVDAAALGPAIVAPEFGVSVVRSCDALNAMNLFAAAVLVFPTGWRARAIGLGLGIPLIFASNILRIVALFLIGVVSQNLFEIVHVYVFQVFIIAIAAGGFFWWASSATTGRLAAQPGAALCR